MPGFTVDEPPNTGRPNAELFAQVRADGRIVDHTRNVLGGSSPLDTVFKLGALFIDPEFQNWEIRIQRWPRDIVIRRGLLSSQWMNIADVAAERDARIFDAEGAKIPVAEFLRRIKDSEKARSLAPCAGP